MRHYKEHIVTSGLPITRALVELDRLASDAILFVVDDQSRLIGSLTDGDVRRGLIRGLEMHNTVDDYLNKQPKSIRKSQYQIQEIIRLRQQNYEVIPVIDDAGIIINVINFRYQKSYLPIDTLIMAGGRGSRLRPLTDEVPKPLLKIGNKPIIEHNIDRLVQFGVDDFWLSIRYLGEQLESYFQNGAEKGVNIEYVWETDPLGTIGAITTIDSFKHEYILVCNSDILTTIDYEAFFLDFLAKDADMSVATIPYSIDIPYAVVETIDDNIVSFKEKPTMTYYSNGGIYLFKRKIIDRIPKDTCYNATDLMQNLIQGKKKLISFPVRQYWLDIGKMEDYEKAQHDIKHLDL